MKVWLAVRMLKGPIAEVSLRVFDYAGYCQLEIIGITNKSGVVNDAGQ